MTYRINLIDYEVAGKKARVIKHRIKTYLSELNYVDFNLLHEYILKLIEAEGCTLKFPPNINGPNVAAHDVAMLNETRTLSKGVIKLDLGIVYKECIIDTAFSYSINTTEYDEIHLLNEQFFQSVQKILMPGLPIVALSKYIQQYYEARKLYVIPELNGHSIKPPLLHVKPLIPPTCTYLNSNAKLKQGQLFTIEPHVAIEPDTLIEGPTKIYLYKTNFYSQRTRPSTLKEEPTAYCSVLLLSSKTNVSFIYEHTYYVAKDCVIRLS